MTIVEFLLARYAEHEQAARAASPGPWSPDEDGYEVLAVDGIEVAKGFALSSPQLRATVQHIALNDPAYVLADLVAKRVIAERHCMVPVNMPGDGEMACLECGSGPVNRPCQTIRLLALPFAAHPDYDPAWAPS